MAKVHNTYLTNSIPFSKTRVNVSIPLILRILQNTTLMLRLIKQYFFLKHAMQYENSFGKNIQKLVFYCLLFQYNLPQTTIYISSLLYYFQRLNCYTFIKLLFTLATKTRSLWQRFQNFQGAWFTEIRWEMH